MNYDINIREEIFGGTLCNTKTGKRVYITSEELKKILENKSFPEDLKKYYKENSKIKFVPLKRKIENHFSFFDIVYIELTRGCNLKCIHCLNDSGKSNKDELSKEEWLDLIDKFSNLGVQEIRFTGGEPLLFSGIYDLIKMATENGICTSLGTNGTLINQKVAKMLKESGLKKAVISIDGNEDVHDAIRGEGNFKKAFQGLNYLKEEGIDVRINSVIMKSNMEDIIKFAKNMHDKKTTLFIRRFIESGRAKKLENNMLTQSDYEIVKEKLKDELIMGPYINGHYLRNDEGIHSRIDLPFKIRGCKAGQRAIAIMPNGDINLCGFLAAQGFPKVENIKNISDWAKFWDELQKHDKLAYLRENLDLYNSQKNVQTTYCLAYIYNYLEAKK